MEQRDPTIGELLEEVKDAPPQILAKIIAFARREREQAAAMANVPGWMVGVPVDDEPLSEATLTRIAEVDEGIHRGEPAIPSEQAWRELLG